MANNQQNLEPLHYLFETTCLEVFDSMKCKIQKVDQAQPVLAVPCAFIEAYSQEVLMTLLLRGPVSVLQQTYPLKNDTKKIEPHELNDWISELSNRFMGSLKNKLLAYDHALMMGTPTKQFGVNVSNFMPEGYESYILNFQTGREVFECSLHTKVLNADISFILQAADDNIYLNDGELEMF